MYLKSCVLYIVGDGAYKAWHYEVNIIQNAGSHNKYLQTGKQLSLIVSNLEPNTQYKVKVRAKSDSGRGPWSEVFTGKTLKEGIQKLINFITPPPPPPPLL